MKLWMLVAMLVAAVVAVVVFNLLVKQGTTGGDVVKSARKVWRADVRGCRRVDAGGARVFRCLLLRPTPFLSRAFPEPTAAARPWPRAFCFVAENSSITPAGYAYPAGGTTRRRPCGTITG